MPENINDMLFGLQLLGDHMRSCKIPIPEHPLMVKLRSDIPNQKIFAWLMQECYQRLETLIGNYRSAQNDPHWRAYETHWKVLPAYCRLHSVLHGLAAWERMNEGYDAGVVGRIQQLALLDKHVLDLFADGGLNQTIAEKILVLSGRELIDPNLNCFHALPLDPTFFQNTTDQKASLPPCFKDCFPNR
jgi:hypothetical protein